MWILLPTFGTIIFVCLYFVASLFYPGGSQVNRNATGFSWVNNYWCNLLNEEAMNGAHNSARPIAICGMFILCMSLSIFWFYFPRYISVNKFLRFAIPISGTFGMTLAFFLVTKFNHDLITNLASLFGLTATIGTFSGLYKTRWFRLFAFGLANILLVVVNNYVYHTKELIVYLPVIQKVSFATFLIWICAVNIEIFNQEKRILLLYCLGDKQDT